MNYQSDELEALKDRAIKIWECHSWSDMAGVIDLVYDLGYADGLTKAKEVYTK